MKTLWDFWAEALSEPFGGQHRLLPEPKAVAFSEATRSRHALILGGTGTGKSRFFEGLVVQDVLKRLSGKSQRGVGVIDVHGDLYRNLRARLALIARRFPKLDEHLYLIDPTLLGWSVAYNPLELKDGQEPELKADMLASVVTTIYRDDPTIVTRMRWLLSHAFLTLILANLPLTELLRLLRDKKLRDSLVAQLGHEELTDYWTYEFPQTQREAIAWAESSLDRLGRFITNPFIRPMLEHTASTIDFRRLLDSGAIVLVNAPKGKIGEDASYLLCTFILAEFQQAALSRIDLPDHMRTPFALLADEFANYTTDTIRQILAESRKVGLELLLAGQELGQMRDEALNSAVLNSVGNIICFRLGRQDAEVLVKSLFTPELKQVKHEQVKPANWGGQIVLPYKDYTWRSLDEIWEIEKRKLTELPDRMLWWKRRGYPGSHLVRAFTVDDIEKLPGYYELPEALQEQEQAAFRLAGVAKKPRVTVQRVNSEEDTPKPGPNGNNRTIYLPPPSDEGPHPRWSG